MLPLTDDERDRLSALLHHLKWDAYALELATRAIQETLQDVIQAFVDAFAPLWEDIQRLTTQQLTAILEAWEALQPAPSASLRRYRPAVYPLYFVPYKWDVHACVTWIDHRGIRGPPGRRQPLSRFISAKRP